MAQQVQCPQCGGYKVVETNVIKTKQKIVHEIPFEKRKKEAITSAVILIPLGIFLMIVSFSGLGPGGLVFILILLPMVIIPFIALLQLPKAKKEGVFRTHPIIEKVESIEYLCNICGKRWNWYPGKPVPSIPTRPDLLVKAESQPWTCPACTQPNAGSIKYCFFCGCKKP